MIYEIKAIPTFYNNVQFRSRLEARWAAFFDLCGWHWDYEPFDLDGWSPDFLVRTAIGSVLMEVKPVDLTSYFERQVKLGGSAIEPFPFGEIFLKASRHMFHQYVCLLGEAPLSSIEGFPIGVIDRYPTGAPITFDDLHTALMPSIETLPAWRRAGNAVQWSPPKSAQQTNWPTVKSIMKSRKAA